MKRLDSPFDRINGYVTYELADGRRITLDYGVGERFGGADILRSAGYADEIPTERLPVMQSGRKVGTLPPDFDPSFIKSKTFLYEPGPGDFQRKVGAWIANRMLGPGELEDVPGFVLER